MLTLSRFRSDWLSFSVLIVAELGKEKQVSWIKTGQKNQYDGQISASGEPSISQFFVFKNSVHFLFSRLQR